MPNATVRANARTMPETTNRRAVLRGILTAGAAAGASSAVVAAAAALGPDHPDAEIFALIERCREVDRFLCATSDAQEKVFWAHVGTAHPPKWTDADASVWPIVTPGEQLHSDELRALRACLALPVLWGTPNFPPQAFAERAREIVAVHADWVGLLNAAREHPDIVAAKAETAAHSDEWGELTERLAGTPAKTVDGMIAKLAMVATDMVYEEGDLGGYDGIAESAALDAVRLSQGRA